MTASDMIRDIYSVSAITLWGALFAVLWRHGPRTLALAVDMIAAITRMSVAMERVAADAQIGREATARIEAACERIEADVSALRELLAEHSGRVEGRADRDYSVAPISSPERKTRPR